MNTYLKAWHNKWFYIDYSIYLDEEIKVEYCLLYIQTDNIKNKWNTININDTM